MSHKGREIVQKITKSQSLAVNSSVNSAVELVDYQQLLEHLMDYRQPFDLYFCIRENESLYVNYVNYVNRQALRAYHIMYACEQGAAFGSVEGVEFTLEPGDVLWIQPGAEFEIYGQEKRGRMSVSVCRFHLRDVQPFRLRENFVIGQVTPREPIFDELFKGGEIQDQCNRMRARATLARIICNVFVGLSSQSSPSNQVGLSVLLRRQSVDYIQRNIRGRFQIAELAEHVGLNADYFARQFKLSFSMTPQTWIKRLRIHEAADHLLASSATVSEIGGRFGYQNVYFFSRQFKEVVSESPRSWRKTRSLE